MANQKHVKILKQGVKAWNEWRGNIEVRPDLIDADLNEANLRSANLHKAHLKGVLFTGARTIYTIFVDNDLSEVIGLDTLRHIGPSRISIDTLHKSGGNIPDAFLRGCGVPDDFITYARARRESCRVLLMLHQLFEQKS